MTVKEDWQAGEAEERDRDGDLVYDDHVARRLQRNQPYRAGQRTDGGAHNVQPSLEVPRHDSARYANVETAVTCLLKTA